MFKKILSVSGAVALVLGIGMNIQYSLNDYGMEINSLSTFALAQTSSSSSNSSSSSSGSSGLFWSLTETSTDCTYSSTPSSGSIGGSVPGGASVTISAGGGAVITYQGKTWECYDGWNPFCSKDCRAPRN